MVIPTPGILRPTSKLAGPSAAEALANRQATSDRPNCLEAALDYAKRGFSVILLHGIVDGHCTCGKADCISPGKHPIGSWKQAQTERESPEQLEGAFRRHPDANVGIVTGAVSGLIVIDIDGAEGRASFAKILSEGPPAVPRVSTGKGYHLYGRHPGPSLKNFVKTYPGLDGRADGGYVVAPPSRHVSGREYRWAQPLEPGLPDLPAELLALFTSPGEQRERSPKRKSRGDRADAIPTVEAPAKHVPVGVTGIRPEGAGGRVQHRCHCADRGARSDAVCRRS